MEKITCPWDGHGKLLPGLTVRQYVQCLADMGVSGNKSSGRIAERAAECFRLLWVVLSKAFG